MPTGGGEGVPFPSFLGGGVPEWDLDLDLDLDLDFFSSFSPSASGPADVEGPEALGESPASFPSFEVSFFPSGRGSQSHLAGLGAGL